MSIITLTSDWGLRAPYVAAVKGAIYRQLPEVIVVDISHLIPLWDLNQTSYVMRNAWPAFPQGTIHIIATDSESSPETPHTAVSYGGHFFIGADNGIFSLIFDSPPDKIVEIEIPQDSDYFTFPGRDVFAKAAVHLANGNPIEELGTVRQSVKEMMPFKPGLDEGLIKGKVIYLDDYGNAVTNISEAFFKEHVGRKSFVITFLTERYRITRISRSYRDVSPGNMLALFGTNGLLHIALNGASARSLLGLELDTGIRIEF
jgi:S-adenosyl-L-methionine hydrolase (adenosine-forming)